MMYDNLEALVVKWRSIASSLEKQATDLDNQRESFTSKYYSSMSEQERSRWNDLRDQAHHLRIERNCYTKLANELEKEIT